MYTEIAGLAPSRWFGEHGYSVGGWEHATVRLLPTGRVEVVAGTSPHGQGHVTSFSQIVADAVGVGFEDVDVLHGDTDVAAWGMDTYGSRSMAVGGVAVRKAAEQVVNKARTIAAQMLEASPDDLEFAGGMFSVRGDPGAATSIKDVAFTAFAAHDLPRAQTPCCRQTRRSTRCLLLPARHALVRGRRRHADRSCHGALLCRRRRRRQGHQPDDRRWADPWRCHPGHGSGALRGGGLRRRGKPGHRLAGRLPRPVGGRRALVRHRPHGDACDDESARRQGRRRSRRNSVHAGRGQRRARRPAAVRRDRYRDAVHPGTRVAGDQRRLAYEQVKAEGDRP